LRGRWTIADDSGRVWQPYVRANLWRDWGAQATTTFSGADLVPLLEQAKRLQLGGGVSVRMSANVSFYAMPTISSLSATATAAGATASAEPPACDIRGEVLAELSPDVRRNLAAQRRSNLLSRSRGISMTSAPVRGPPVCKASTRGVL
jgi:hypothetical protein